MKQYEYMVEYALEDYPYKQFINMPSYEVAMTRAIHIHNNGVKEVGILRRLISEWKSIHQSKFSRV